ncbi:SDR family NAD(P)-dependent oxidoreductase [Sphingopyxis sp.]|uniref:SDR family NAD(P)-dependent oxidoreductase n=1 Tax=Sphingopyxis sp. TaxID=1908224 RepID=UPI002FC69A64
MSIRLAGRTAVITGAASGIGAALARHAAARGMAVAACDRDAAGLQALSSELERRETQHIVRQVDVSDVGSLQAFAADCAALPPIALLFANAGILRGGGVLAMPIDQWRALTEVNLIGAVATLQAFVPAMIAQEAAQVVVTGSTGSMTCGAGLSAYCATKHALWPMVEALQAELEGTPVGASLLMPGAVSTPIFDAIDPDRPPPADSLSPDAVAEIAFAGALAGDGKILTHPAYVERIRARFAQVLTELSEQ